MSEAAPANTGGPDLVASSVIVAIELLKRGADVVDLHVLGVRLCRTADDSASWSVAQIPPEPELMPRPAPAGLGDFDDANPPMSGGEEQYGAEGATELGATPARE